MFILLAVNSFGQSQFMTLDDCIKEALENNPRLNQLKHSINLSASGIESSKADKSPTITLTQDASVSQRKGGNLTDSYTTSLGVRYTIFDSNRSDLSISLSEKSYQKILNNYQQAEIEVISSVKDAYYKIIQKKEALKVSDSILARRKSDLALIKLKYEIGRESMQAVAESESNLADAEYRKISATRELEDAFFELNLLMDRNLWEQYAIDEKSIYDNIEITTDYEKLIDIAFKNRIDISNSKIDIEIAKLNLEQEQVRDKPELSASATNTHSGDKPFENHSYNFGVTYKMTFNLHDGGKKNIRLNDSKIRIIQAEDNYNTLVNNVKNEIKSALTSYELSLKQLDLSRRTLESRRDIYTLTKLQYEQGNTTYFFLQQKESELTNAEYSYINSLYNLKSRAIRLVRTLGRSEI